MGSPRVFQGGQDHRREAGSPGARRIQQPEVGIQHPGHSDPNRIGCHHEEHEGREAGSSTEARQPSRVRQWKLHSKGDGPASKKQREIQKSLELPSFLRGKSSAFPHLIPEFGLLGPYPSGIHGISSHPVHEFMQDAAHGRHTRTSSACRPQSSARPCRGKYTSIRLPTISRPVSSTRP